MNSTIEVNNGSILVSADGVTVIKPDKHHEIQFKHIWKVAFIEAADTVEGNLDLYTKRNGNIRMKFSECHNTDMAEAYAEIQAPIGQRKQRRNNILYTVALCMCILVVTVSITSIVRSRRNDLSFDSVLASLDMSLYESFGNNFRIESEVSHGTPIISVFILIEGAAIDVTLAIMGVDEYTEAWQRTINDFINLSVSARDDFKVLGYDPLVSFSLLNDIDTDGIMLAVVNGLVMFNVFNEVDIPLAPEQIQYGLEGSWLWNGREYYVFEFNGTGTMSGTNIDWSSWAGLLSICSTPDLCQGNCIAPTEWYYTLESDQLTLTSRLSAALTYVYTRR